MKPPSRLAFATAMAVDATLIASPLQGQDFPLKPVRLIAGNPGATADILSRHIGQRLAQRWGQPVVVDNRGGAGATIAADIAARAQADGHTLLMGQLNSHGIAVSLHRKLSYHPVRDFAPVTRVAWVPQVLVVHPAMPGGTLREFFDYARQRPGIIDFASAGHGTASHLTTELLKQRAGLDLVHVQYKGGAAATRAIMSGEVKTGFIALSTAFGVLKTGKVKALAIASRERSAAIPGLPTFGEAGLPGFESATWFGVLAPAGTARPLIERLNRQIVEILRARSTGDELLKLGAIPVPGTPEEFAAFIRSEIEKWRGVIKTAGIQRQ